MTDQDEPNYRECIAAFKRAQNNAVFFIEQYWNASHPDKALALTDEEREQIFKAYKGGVPYFNDWGAMQEYSDKIQAQRDKGLKDWEIF